MFELNHNFQFPDVLIGILNGCGYIRKPADFKQLKHAIHQALISVKEKAA